MLLEVRCCCQPQKLRGHLEVADHLVREGRRLAFPIFQRPPGPYDPNLKVEHVSLEVATFIEGGFGYLALKSEDIPVETLRQLRNFKPADE